MTSNKDKAFKKKAGLSQNASSFAKASKNPTVIELENNDLPVASIYISNKKDDGSDDSLGDHDAIVDSMCTEIPHAIPMDQNDTLWSKPVSNKSLCTSRRVLVGLLCALVGLPLLAVISFHVGKHKEPSKNLSDSSDPNIPDSRFPTSTESPKPAESILWKKIGQDIDGVKEVDFFGKDVSISQNGNILAVGSNSGFAVYAYEDCTWKQKGSYISYCDLGNQTLYSQCTKEKPTRFGVALSDDGARILSGAAYEDFGLAAVHEYNEEESSWQQLGETMYGEHPSDQYGALVDLSSKGDRVAVYATYGNYIGIYDLVQKEDGNTNSFTWTKTGDIRLKLFRQSDGKHMALSGNGHILAKSDLDSNRVSIYTDQGSDGTWEKLSASVNIKHSVYSRFGDSISLSESGNRIAVGAPHSNLHGIANQTVLEAGLVVVFEYDPDSNSWDQMGNAIYDSETTFLHLGFSVCLSGDGNRLVTGAFGTPARYGHESAQTNVQMYEFVENTWTQLGEDIHGEDKTDWFGYSAVISKDGNIVAASGPMNDGDHATNSGHVRVFEFNSSQPC